MTSPGRVPCNSHANAALPSVHGFRLCRSLPSCVNHAQRCPVRSGRSSLQISAASGLAAPAPLEHLSFDGEAQGPRELSLFTASQETANGLVHRYVTLARQNARRGTASTLTRSEVRGGGRKPFAQKGTGNARQGSIRTPLKPGGGVIFGPKPRDWSIKMNKKERRLAYATAFQNAAESITVVDDLESKLNTPRTKELATALKRFGVLPDEHALVIVDSLFDNLRLASRNNPRVRTNTVSSLSIYDLLRADRIVVEASALAYIQDFYGKASERAAAEVEASAAEAESSASEGEAPFEGSDEPAESGAQE